MTVDFWLNKGKLLFASHCLYEALDAFNKVLEIDPFNEEAIDLRRYTLSYIEDSKQKNLKSTLNKIDKDLQLHPNDAKILHQKAIALSFSGDAKQALEAFEHAATIEPNEPNLSHNKAIFLDVMDRHEEALFAYNKISDSKNKESIDEKDFKEIDVLKNYHKAIIDYSRLSHHKLDHNDDIKLSNFETGQPFHDESDRLVIAFDKILEIDPDNLDALVNKAKTLREIGDFSTAIITYDLALKLSPSDPSLWFERGISFKHLANYEEQIKFFDENNYVRYKELEQFDLRQEALKSFDTALSIEPYNKSIRYYKINLLTELEQFTDVLDACKKYIETEKYDADIWYYQGNAFLHLDENKLAIESFKLALELDNHTLDAVAKNKIRAFLAHNTL